MSSSTFPSRIDERDRVRSDRERGAEKRRAALASAGKSYATAWQPKVTLGAAGDHHSAHRLLVSVFHGPSSVEFQAQLDLPGYEPADRLLVKRGAQIVAHARIVRRELQFGGLQVKSSLLADLATAPEFRRRGCATALIRAAEQDMHAHGDTFGLARTETSEFFTKRGWTICGSPVRSIASARDILSYLREIRAHEESFPNRTMLAREPLPISIRLWRHVEQAALMRLYEINTQQAYGATVRTDAYWRWLVGRGGCDRIYIAIEGSPKFELDDTLEPIVGYAAMRENRLVEMMTMPRRDDVALKLLARACGDAIERDDHSVIVESAPGHLLHAVLKAAGGKSQRSDGADGLTNVVKLFEPLTFLDSLGEMIRQRAVAAGLGRACELGIAVGTQKVRIVVKKQQLTITHDRVGRNCITCDNNAFTQLLLGQLNVPEAIAAGTLEAATATAAEVAAALFPRLPLWFPPLDDLPA